MATEHLLLGLLREEEGVAFQVLRNLGVDTEGLRGDLAELLRNG
jgi:ATP-dependent Clp protease ATP-binding subunit ClpC